MSFRAAAMMAAINGLASALPAHPTATHAPISAVVHALPSIPTSAGFAFLPGIPPAAPAATTTTTTTQSSLKLHAHPPTSTHPSLECLVVDFLVDELRLCASATPFCSSYLGIQTSSITTTTTTTLAPVTATTSTTYTTDTITPPVSSFSTTITTTITTCSPSNVDAAGFTPAKRSASMRASATKHVAAVPTPDVLAALAKPAISTACSCLDIPTPSTTITVTATSSPTVTTTLSFVATTTLVASSTTSTAIATAYANVCPTPPQCNNQGLQWAYYANYPSAHCGGYQCPNWDPTVLKTSSPSYGPDTITSVGGFDENPDEGDQIQFYNSTEQLDFEHISLNHRGYFFAQLTGTYTFNLTNVDDVGMLWIGPNAYSGWSRDNADIIDNNVYSVDLQQGQYYPFRIAYGNTYSHLSYQLEITDPNGTDVADSAYGGEPYLVQYSCDGTTAPQYPAFGSET